MLTPTMTRGNANDDAKHGEEGTKNVPAQRAQRDFEDSKHSRVELSELNGLVFSVKFSQFFRGEETVLHGLITAD
jgi:hypothetical protein